jgi:hypothetical protein
MLYFRRKITFLKKLNLLLIALLTLIVSACKKEAAIAPANTTNNQVIQTNVWDQKNLKALDGNLAI